MKLVKDTDKTQTNKDQVTDLQAEEAFKTILKWIGEDPSREGLLETPKRVTKAYKEYFKGYHQDPMKDLKKTSISNISNIAAETSAEVIKQLINVEVNKSSVSAIVEEVAKKEMGKHI